MITDRTKYLRFNGPGPYNFGAFRILILSEFNNSGDLWTAFQNAPNRRFFNQLNPYQLNDFQNGFQKIASAMIDKPGATIYCGIMTVTDVAVVVVQPIVTTSNSRVFYIGTSANQENTILLNTR